MSLLNKKYALENGIVAAELFDLPERIVQFGTGVLLRGLPDYLIDKANRQGTFNGRAVVIKTTNSDASDFPNQDCLFTLSEKGMGNQTVVNQTRVISTLSRLLNASDEWSEILALAERPEVNIIISNTTEAGIKYVEEDLFATPPRSFPAKLTAFLFRKFEKLGQKAEAVVVPTELLVGNGEILRGMVERHAERQGLSAGFQNWLKNDCRFCNSLVDRIVPGATPTEERKALEKQLGYEDNLMITAEPFLLWAIEGDDFVRQKLSFAAADSRLIIAADISQFREQKLRLLNGGHTISVPLAFLKGLKTVGEMMNDAEMSVFTEGVVQGEILSTLLPPVGGIEGGIDASVFANAVLDRFRNPFIEHKLTSILVQTAAKMDARNTATFVRYFQKNGHLPPLMTLGFAAYLLYTQHLAAAEDHAPFFEKLWQQTDDMDLASLCDFVEKAVKNPAIFDKSLSEIPHFIETVAEQIFSLTTHGIAPTLDKVLSIKLF